MSSGGSLAVDLHDADHGHSHRAGGWHGAQRADRTRFAGTCSVPDEVVVLRHELPGTRHDATHIIKLLEPPTIVASPPSLLSKCMSRSDVGEQHFPREDRLEQVATPEAESKNLRNQRSISSLGGE